MKTFGDQEKVLRKVRWHIQNNFTPSYTAMAVDGMVETIRQFMCGNKSLSSEILPGAGVTVAELLDDLRISVEDLT